MKKTEQICEILAIPRLDKVEVDVIAQPKVGGGINWSHSVKSVGHDNNGKIKLPKGLGYKIKFDLKANGFDVRFDASAPFFCKEGTTNPCPGSLMTDQCMVDDCDADTLTVIDWNYGDEQELRYQLNFVNSAGKRVEPYDPIIQNDGGGVKPSFA